MIDLILLIGLLAFFILLLRMKSKKPVKDPFKLKSMWVECRLSNGEPVVRFFKVGDYVNKEVTLEDGTKGVIERIYFESKEEEAKAEKARKKWE